MKQSEAICTIFGDFVARNTNNVHLDKDVADIIKNADISICNFEAPITNKEEPVPKSGPSLNQAFSSAALLEKIGFNTILLGNNHIMDYGEEGAILTKKSFKSATVLGVGTYEEVYRVKVIECNNVKIGLLSLVQYEFGVIEDSSKDTFGVAWILHPNIADIIRSAKQEVDYLLVFPHAGLEDEEYPLPEWKVVYKKIIDWGADAVVASHPHIVQGWEVYKERPIFYSLGNFYFDNINEQDTWYRGLAVQLFLEDKKVQFKVMPIVFTDDGNIVLDNTKRTVEYLASINETLSIQEKYLKQIDTICEKYYSMYANGMIRGLNAISFRRTNFSDFIRQSAYILFNKPCEHTLLNIIRCESHRWALQRAIYNKIKV